MLDGTRVVFNLGLFFPHCFGNTLLSLLPDALWTMSFSTQAEVNINYFNLLWAVNTFCLCYFWAVLFLAFGNFLTCMSWSKLIWRLKWGPMQLSGALVLVIAVFYLVLCPLPSALWSYWLPHFISESKNTARLDLNSSFLCHSLETLWGRRMAKSQGSFCWVPISQVSVSHYVWGLMFENHLFMYIARNLVVSCGKVNLFPIIPSCSDISNIITLYIWFYAFFYRDT